MTKRSRALLDTAVTKEECFNKPVIVTQTTFAKHSFMHRFFTKDDLKHGTHCQPTHTEAKEEDI